MILQDLKNTNKESRWSFCLSTVVIILLTSIVESKITHLFPIFWLSLIEGGFEMNTFLTQAYAWRTSDRIVEPVFSEVINTTNKWKSEGHNTAQFQRNTIYLVFSIVNTKYNYTVFYLKNKRNKLLAYLIAMYASLLCNHALLEIFKPRSIKYFSSGWLI